MSSGKRPLSKSLPSREDAKDWIIDNQLNRRNLTPQQAAYLRGQLYRNQKERKGGPRRSKEGEIDQREKSSPWSGSHKTAKQIAEISGVSEKTVREDAKYAESLDAIAVNDTDSRWVENRLDELEAEARPWGTNQHTDRGEEADNVSLQPSKPSHGNTRQYALRRLRNAGRDHGDG